MSLNPYYMSEEGEDSPFICSAPRENGMRRCKDVPPYSQDGLKCTLPASDLSFRSVASGNFCVNWYQYYNDCRPGELNPHRGAVNFDNIGYAWIAIFQVSGDKCADLFAEGKTQKPVFAVCHSFGSFGFQFCCLLNHQRQYLDWAFYPYRVTSN